MRSGVNATPAFVVNGWQHEGTYAFEDLAAAVEMYVPAIARLQELAQRWHWPLPYLLPTAGNYLRLEIASPDGRT